MGDPGTGPGVGPERPVPGVPVPRCVLPGWAERFGLVAGITTRGGPEAPWDHGLTTGGAVGQVLDRWRRLQTDLGFPAMVTSRQVHEAALATHGEPVAGWRLLDGRDGHLTCSDGVLLTVTVADCVPLFLADPRSGALALLHAGWRGTAAGILERGVEQLLDLAGGAVENLVMHCGVAICGDCYEVGPEVFDALGLAPPPGGRGPLDLRAVLADRARRAGVGEISTSQWCSAHHDRVFFSHRRSRGADGRMAAFLGRPAGGDAERAGAGGPGPRH